MTTENEKQLKTLLSQFYDSEQSDQALDDINWADKVFDSQPAAAPSDSVTSRLKQNITARLAQQKLAHIRLRRYEAVAVAAAIVIIAFAGLRFFTATQTLPKLAVIASAAPILDVFAETDSELETLEDEIDQLQSDILALRFEQDNDINEDLVDQLETDFIETETDFWKG